MACTNFIKSPYFPSKPAVMLIMLSVSEPSTGSIPKALSRGLIPLCLAASSSSEYRVENAVRFARKYWLRNWSPSARPLSTASACCLVCSSTTFRDCICPASEACCRSRSSADPPGGNSTSPAATRFAAASTPSTPRSTTLGSRKLNLLSIIHRDSHAVQGLVLRRRKRAVAFHRAEQRRFFQPLQESDHRLGRLRADGHVQQHFIVRSDRRKPHLNYFDVVRQHALQIRENLAPAHRFSLHQRVQ